MRRALFAACLLACLCLPTGLSAQQDLDDLAFDEDVGDALAEDVEPGSIDLKIQLLNLFLWRNDTDFDRTAPHYAPDGQSMGVLGTFVMPDLTFHVLPNLRLFYELEIGLNVWSLHNPDQQDATAPDMFLMKHRELYAEGEFLDGWLGFKVGYQRWADPTRLFVDSWMGAASLISDMGFARFTATLGQLPDPTYEGFRYEANNFAHDLFVYALVVDRTFVDFVTLRAGVVGMEDARVVGRTKRIWAPSLNLEADLEGVTLGVDAIAQVGRFEGAARANGDQDHLAWATQIYGQAQMGRLFTKLNLLALSGDDGDPANGTSGAFHYSAKNRSSTIFFTESEVRDTFDNLDEKLSTNHGGLFGVRPGMFLADLALGYDVWRGIRPTIIAGYAMAQAPDNALGNRHLGVELDAGVEYSWRDLLVVQAYGGVLLPGKALAATVNGIDLAATDPVWSCSIALKVFY